MNPLLPMVLVASGMLGQTETPNAPTVHTMRNQVQVLQPLIGEWTSDFTAESDLKWDIGTWKKGEKLTIRQTFEWILADTAVEREISIENEEGKLVFSWRKELIAWVPARYRIESHYLRSRGEYGFRTWSRTGNTYTLSTETTDKEGRFSTFGQVITIDGDTLTMHQAHRKINGEPQRDTDKEVYKRIRDSD